MKAYVYVDGYNLYYRALKGFGLRWVDLVKLAKAMMPDDEIVAVKYFTARIPFVPWDPEQASKQRSYWDALRTLPEVQIIQGSFRDYTHDYYDAADYERAMAATGGAIRRPSTHRVVRPEEKGSDVNLASHLIHDAHRGLFEVAGVISNDSDLSGAVKIVKSEVGLPVVVLTPEQKNPSRELRQSASAMRTIKRSAVSGALLPDLIEVEGRTIISKPGGW